MKKNSPIYSGPDYQIWPDKVTQLPYKADILTDSKNNIWIESNLAEEYNGNYTLDFKLSINGQDNELVFYHHHHILLERTACQEVQIIFGQIHKTDRLVGQLGLPEQLHIIADLSSIFQHTDSTNNTKTTKKAASISLANDFSLATDQDFELYLAGQSPLLTWDFDALQLRPEFRFSPISGQPYHYELRLSIADLLPKKRVHIGPAKPGKPALKHDFPLASALFRLGLKETEQNLNPQRQFRAGKNWEGVWTRDLAYSVILGLSHWWPQETENSLIAKIKDDKAVQDTGTGGAWPCSSDRILWVWAAWQHYLATGSNSWLQTIYKVSVRTLEAAQEVVYESQNGLFKGETSFLDWREQSYPAWCSPSQIAQSISLSTNLAHLAAYQATSQMAILLGKDVQSRQWQEKHDLLHKNIQKYFPNLEQYSYGAPFPALVDAHDSLALAMSLLTRTQNRVQPNSESVPELTSKILDLLEFGPYGFACFWPQIPHIAPYHNHAVWPFVQSLVALGAAQAGGAQGLRVVEYVAAGLWRSATLFASNKENLNAESGHARHTLLNSDAQLWSTTGMCSMFLQIFAGLKLETNHFWFQPLLPQSFAGESEMVIENIWLRKVKINIRIKGWGVLDSLWFGGLQIDNNISYEWLKQQADSVEFLIILTNKNLDYSKINQTQIEPIRARLDMPTPVRKGNMLCWAAVSGAANYQIRINGQIESQTEDLAFFASFTSAAQFVQIRAISPTKAASFWSTHIVFCPPNCFLTKNIALNCNEKISFSLDMHNAGSWLVYFVFANGNGPINTGNSCAIRTLSCDQIDTPTKIILPHTSGWQVFEHSAPVEIELGFGLHEFVLYQSDQDQNMNGAINNAFIKSVELYKI